MKDLRLREIGALLYRLALAYFFYQIARLLFWWYNRDLIPVDSVGTYLKLAWHGFAFDTTAILYVNALFILLSLLPLTLNTGAVYQRILFWVYFVMNGIAYSLNFVDFIYYRFAQGRLTSAAIEVSKNETNLLGVFGEAMRTQWSVVVWFVVLMALWMFLYRRMKIRPRKVKNRWVYFIGSVIGLVIVAVLTVGGIRGDFKHSTRPINLVDANRHVEIPAQGNIVLNSTFSFFRTLFTNNFKTVQFVPQEFIDEELQPIKQYNREVSEPRPNVVIFILESFGREYSGAFNPNTSIPNFVSYTPFLDSLAQDSFIFTQAVANGRQSIHGMSSVLAGIPSLKDAFTGSPFANQKIQSIVSVSKEMGYDTSFFHGAPNGSMGFQGFANILGFDHYYGKTDYNNDADYDGIWGIWDEPFFQFFAQTLNHKKQPFFATLFSVSSHHPFKVPTQYEGKFNTGTLEIHAPVQYTDHALREFFRTARKMPWYRNTIFVFVADHINQIGYAEYQKAVNHFAVPIMFYSPNPKYGLHGASDMPAQQMDIYPSLVDLMGYNKPIRSWGQSLFSETDKKRMVVNSDGISEYFLIGNYRYRFDGKEVTGIFKKEDLALERNVLGKEDNAEIRRGIMLVKAWYQDYMDRVINRKLSPVVPR